MTKIGCFIESSKHIAIITPGFPKDENDSTCISALQLYINELRLSNFEVSIFSLHYPFKSDNYKWNGCNVIPLNSQNKWFRKLFLFKKLKKAFNQIHSENKFDFIHSFWLMDATFCGQRLALENRIPILATAMGQDVLKSNKWLKKINHSRLNECMTLSKFHQNQLIENWKIQSEIIHFGIDEKMRSIQRKSTDIIGVGNLIALKNFQYFVELIAEISKSKNDLKVKIIGIGTEMNSLQKMIDDSQLSKVIELCGELDYPKTMIEISKSKVLLHPSDFESFGMILIEGLAQNVHVFAGPTGIAFEEELINKLSFDLAHDAKEIKVKLMFDEAPMKLYSVKETVCKYSEIYARL